MRLFKGREATRESTRLRRVVLCALVAPGLLGLVLFHLHLLWQRLSDQSVLEPVVAGKWLVTLLLLAVLWRLKTRGYRLLASRPAGVVWLLALLLHVQLPMVPASDVAGLPDLGWLAALPVTASFGAALAVTLGLALTAASSAVVQTPDGALRRGTRRLGGPLSRSLPALACRPPPSLS